MSKQDDNAERIARRYVNVQHWGDRTEEIRASLTNDVIADRLATRNALLEELEREGIAVWSNHLGRACFDGPCLCGMEYNEADKRWRALLKAKKGSTN